MHKASMHELQFVKIKKVKVKVHLEQATKIQRVIEV